MARIGDTKGIGISANINKPSAIKIAHIGVSFTYCRCPTIRIDMNYAT